eukprot:SAG31_NODE_11900_length_987_cov_2.529279_2_plen_165_part_01
MMCAYVDERCLSIASINNNTAPKLAMPNSNPAPAVPSTKHLNIDYFDVSDDEDDTSENNQIPTHKFINYDSENKSEGNAAIRIAGCTACTTCVDTSCVIAPGSKTMPQFATKRRSKATLQCQLAASSADPTEAADTEKQTINCVECHNLRHDMNLSPLDILHSLC